MQVLNVHRYHWITVSTIGCPKGQVNVFDSLPCVDVPSRTKEQIAAICFMEASSITLNFPNMQKQRGHNDCGLFALAFAMSLCARKDPCKTNYIQHKFRVHLIECLENRSMSLFPKHRRNRVMSVPAPRVQFSVYCLCRQPKSGRMVECEKCKEWFHEECVEVPSIVWNYKTEPWKCCKCNKI